MTAFFENTSTLPKAWYNPTGVIFIVLILPTPKIHNELGKAALKTKEGKQSKRNERGR
jgi:hypothetical protein